MVRCRRGRGPPFLRRVWSFAQAYQATLTVAATPAAEATRAAVQGDTQAQDLRRQVHELLRQADFDLGRRQYNTVVSAAMKMLNTLKRPPRRRMRSMRR